MTDVEEHLRDHLTDGRWHDDCWFCRRRRERGGTGVLEPPFEGDSDDLERRGYDV